MKFFKVHSLHFLPEFMSDLASIELMHDHVLSLCSTKSRTKLSPAPVRIPFSDQLTLYMLRLCSPCTFDCNSYFPPLFFQIRKLKAFQEKVEKRFISYQLSAPTEAILWPSGLQQHDHTVSV